MYVLIAEDDLDDALMLKDAFNELGITELTFVNNGRKLLTHLEEAFLEGKRPAFIVLDINMPIMDGKEVIKRLKVNPKTRAIPIAVLSTTKREKDKEEVLKLGADEFFTKPPSFNELSAITLLMSEKWLNLEK